MNQALEKIQDDLRCAWRFRWWALSVAMLVSVIGWLVIFALPDRFEASARVFVDTRTALKPVLQNLAVEQDIDAQLNLVRQSLLAGPQLRKIAADSGVLAPTVTDPAQEAGILTAMANRISLTMRSASDRESERDTGGSIYSISYQDQSRPRSLKVTDALVNTFVEQTLGGKRQGAETAQRFLEQQIKEYDTRLRTAEDRLADFKKRYVGLMPAEQGGYFGQLQHEIDAVKTTENQLSVTQSRRNELARQMRGEAAIAGSSTVAGPPGAASGSDTVSRIRETQARLDDLLLRFTDKHPDVVAARETLQELQKRRAAEIESLRRGDPGAAASSGAASNPVFQNIQLQLNQADVEIASLRGTLEQHRAKAAELRRLLDTAPRVEAEFAQLNRDYDVNKAQHAALLASYEKARLSEQADSAGSVRFEIVQPPTASYSPVFPRRTMLLAVVLVAGFAIGGAIAYLLHMLKPVVGSARSLAELTGLQVLGVVSSAFPATLAVSARRDLWRFAAGVGCLLVGFLVVLGLNWSGVRIGSISGVG
jgi:polysaccharide chain length determinant protein (PEP-CTERM system associated)